MPDKPLKILLVDDDKFLLDMYLLKFQKAGVETDTAENSLKALEKLRAENSYDIVLVDIIMPGMDGLQFMQTVRDEKLAPKSSFIMLTNQQDGQIKAGELGVDGYIIKATTIPSEVVEKVLSIYNSKHKS